MFPSLWSVGGPVWLSSDDLLIAIQYGSLEKEPLSHLVIGKEVVTWSHCKSCHVIQLRIHLSVFQLQNVMKECNHPGILNSLLIKSNQMLSVFLILRVSFSFRGSTFVFDVFIVALSCFDVPPLPLLMHPEPFAQFSLQLKYYFSRWTNSWPELWKLTSTTIHVSFYCSWHNGHKGSFDK